MEYISSLQQLHKDLEGYNLLTDKEEKELFKRFHEGDSSAKDILVYSNIGLINKVAKQYENRGMDLEDLFSEGVIGIMEAVDTFDLNKNCKFSTHCVWKIQQKISRAVANKGRAIRLPAYVVEKNNKIKKAERELTVSLGRVPTEEEIMIHAGVDEKAFTRYKENMFDISSLDLSIDEDSGATIGDLIEDNYFINPLDNYLDKTKNEEICKILDTLDKTEADIIKYHYGLNEEPKDYDEIAKIIGITKDMLKQIEEKALRKLRSPLRMKMIQELVLG